MGMRNGLWSQEWPWPRGGPSSDRVPSGATEPLVGSQPHPGSGLGSLECRDGAASLAVTAGGSLCLVPEEPPREWREIQWRVKMDSGEQRRILTATRDGTVSYPEVSQRRAEFQPGNLSLCLSPVHGADSGLYWAEFENSSRIFRQCFRVSVWAPVPQPELRSQLLQRARGWCRLALLCSGPGNVSYSWACPGEPPGAPPEPGPEPGIPSRLVRKLPEGAEPQICLCNVSNPAGWSAARARLTCPENFQRWTPLAVSVSVAVAVGLLLLLVGGCCWWRKRRKNSREGTPGAPPEQALTIYAEVGEKKPRQDPGGSSEATQEGATVYAVVAPRTLEHPRQREEPGNLTVYSTVQIGRRPSSIKRKRLERSLVSTAFLEDNGGYRRLGFPNPAGHQGP